MIFFFEIPIILILIFLAGIFSINMKIPLLIITPICFIIGLLFAVSCILDFREENSFQEFIGAALFCFINGWLFVNAVKTSGVINLFVILGWLF